MIYFFWNRILVTCVIYPVPHLCMDTLLILQSMIVQCVYTIFILKFTTVPDLIFSMFAFFICSDCFIIPLFNKYLLLHELQASSQLLPLVGLHSTSKSYQLGFCDVSSKMCICLHRPLRMSTLLFGLNIVYPYINNSLYYKMYACNMLLSLVFGFYSTCTVLLHLFEIIPFYLCEPTNLYPCFLNTCF